MIHIDGQCVNTDNYQCHDGHLHAPRPEDAEPGQATIRIMRCYCPCHQETP